jgi:hypothetical protein
LYLYIVQERNIGKNFILLSKQKRV